MIKVRISYETPSDRQCIIERLKETNQLTYQAFLYIREHWQPI